MEDGRFRTVLTTRGRRTGRPHSVPLLAVAMGGRVYLSRRRPDGDWYRNALACPSVTVEVGGAAVAGSAEEVRDPAELRAVSEAKYPGQARASEPRAAVRVTLCGL